MSDAIPPSTLGGYVGATAPIVQYPPEYFGFGAVGFCHVSMVLNDLALAAKSTEAMPAAAEPSPLAAGPQLNGQLENNGGKLANTRRRAPLAPYSATRKSRGYNIWKAVMGSIPSPSKERITATYPGCCDGFNAGDWSTLRKHQFSAFHACHLENEDLQYIPVGLCPACPGDLGCRDEGQRVDIYSQKGRHFDTCMAYRALCERTNTKPEPILTNRAAVKALLEERDLLRLGLGFETLKKTPPTLPITPLPLVTPVVAHTLPLHGAPIEGAPIEQEHSPIGLTSMPSLTLSRSPSTASSRVLTPPGQADFLNSCPPPLMPLIPLDGITTRDFTRNPDAPFPVYFSPNVFEWKNAQNIFTPMHPEISSFANELSVNWDLLAAIPSQGGEQINDHRFLHVDNLGIGTQDELDLHAGNFQVEVTLNEQPGQVNGDGSGPFLSSTSEGPVELPAESFPVNAPQQHAPADLPPELYELISAELQRQDQEVQFGTQLS